jgi:putative ABC transport system substrate-binding protein
MRRRELIAQIAGATVWPLAAHAQPTARIYRVGFVFPNATLADMAGPHPANRYAAAFVQALRGLGYLEGQNLVLERRSAEGRYERFQGIVAELAASKVDVIVGASDALAEAGGRAGLAVPIVVAGLIDPLQTGVVASLARPGGNVTGFTFHTGSEIEGRRLQMLVEAVPQARRVAYLGTKLEWEGPDGTAVRTTAQTLGVSLLHADFAATNYAGAFEIFAPPEKADAIFASRSGTHYINGQAIAAFALAQRLPSTHAWRDIVEAGALMSYGSNYADILGRAASYVDAILKGAKPGELPVQQPVKFELIINLRTATTLGLDLPPTLVARADEVIE